MFFVLNFLYEMQEIVRTVFYKDIIRLITN